MEDTVKQEGYDIVEASQAVTIRDYTPGEVFHVYGSPMRPMSASWAKIHDAVFVNAGRIVGGKYIHTFLVVPHQLDAATFASYELVWLYGPIIYKPDKAQ